MRRQRLVRFSLVFISCLLLIVCYPRTTTRVEAAEPKKPSVLLIYDSYALGTPREGNIEGIERVLASFGVGVTLTSYDKYEKGTMLKYDRVLSIRNMDDLTELPESVSQDMKAYDGEYMHIGNGLPTKIRQAMHLEDQLVEQDTLQLEIGQFSQSSITATGVSYITKFEGTSYGQMTSERRKSSSPYGVLSGKNAYIPYMVKGNLSEQATSYVLKDWLSIQTPSHNYVLLNEIYPFSDLDMLNEVADRLYNAGIPFIVSVQPVLNNLDFPATKRYMEALKHVQARNGSVVVHSPAVNSTISQDITVLKSQMSAFIDALAGYGIVPLGIGTELYWSYDKHFTVNGLSFFDSGIIFPNERIMYRAQTNTSSVFASSIYTMRAEDLSKYKTKSLMLDPLPMNTAFVYPFPEDRNEMEQTIDILLGSWTTFADYKNEAHSVRTETNELTSRSGHLQRNGQAVYFNSNIAEVDADHAYVQEVKKSFTTLFSIQNNIFIVLILVTLLIFMVFLLIGYRMYKRKFMHQESSL